MKNKQQQSLKKLIKNMVNAIEERAVQILNQPNVDEKTVKQVITVMDQAHSKFESVLNENKTQRGNG